MANDYNIANAPIGEDENTLKVEMKVDLSPKKEGKDIEQYHDRNLDQYLTSINPDREYCYCTLCKKIFNDR